MESDRLYKDSYDYLCVLCKENHTNEITIDYTRLDNITQGWLRETIRTYLHDCIVQLTKVGQCLDCNAKIIEYCTNLRKQNSANSITIDFTKASVCPNCNCTILSGLHTRITGIIIKRRREIFDTISKAR
jgi:uncharacterized protein with PIN domain